MCENGIGNPDILLTKVKELKQREENNQKLQSTMRTDASQTTTASLLGLADTNITVK